MVGKTHEIVLYQLEVNQISDFTYKLDKFKFIHLLQLFPHGLFTWKVTYSFTDVVVPTSFIKFHLRLNMFQ